MILEPRVKFGKNRLVELVLLHNVVHVRVPFLERTRNLVTRSTPQIGTIFGPRQGRAAAAELGSSGNHLDQFCDEIWVFLIFPGDKVL
jgi:hypothetical protein